MCSICCILFVLIIKLAFYGAGMNYRYNIALFLITLFLNSCVKDDGMNPYDSPSDLSSLASFNAVPGTSELSLFLDGARLNKTDEKFSFSEFMSHRNVYPGEKKLNIEGVYVKGEKIRTLKDISLHAGNIYSLFLYEERGIQTLLTKDNIVVPKEGYAKIRLAHMVKDAPALSIWDKERPQPLFGNIPFKGVTEFIEVKADEIVELHIIPSGDRRNKSLEISQTFVPRNKAFYTLMVVGLINAEDKEQEVSLQVIEF